MQCEPGISSPHGLRFNPPYLDQWVPHIAGTTTLAAGEFTGSFGIADRQCDVKEGYGEPKGLDCPMRLRDVGVQAGDFPHLAAAVMEECRRWRIHGRSTVLATSSGYPSGRDAVRRWSVLTSPGELLCW